MSDALSPEALAALQSFGTAALCNAIETFATRLRNEGYTDQSIRPVADWSTPMVGYVLPLQMRTDTPPVDRLGHADRSDWWDVFLTPPFPKIVAIEDVSRVRGVGAVAGETHARIFKALGAAGIMTNGAVRDTQALRRLGMSVFSAGVVPSHAYAHIVSVGEPVTIGGLALRRGDLVHGDGDGIVKIPQQLAAELPRVAAGLAAEEKTIFDLCGDADFSPLRLRAVLAAVAAARGDV